jgi:hypothetical protein
MRNNYLFFKFFGGKTVYPFLLAIVFFGLLLLMDPFSDIFHNFRSDDYALVKTEVDKRSCVIEYDYGNFIIHTFHDPHRRNTLLFKRDMILKIYFSKAEQSLHQELQIGVWVNDRRVSIIRMSSNKLVLTTIKVARMDRLKFTLLPFVKENSTDAVMHLTIESQYANKTVWIYYTVFSLLVFFL